VSQWVVLGANDQLQYKTDPQGNRIMDFSSAGYQGGGVALPTAPVVQMVGPGAGDRTAAIQAAIAAVASAPADASGLRGAVLLAPGTYDVSGTLTLGASGVVLRGSGSGLGGTVLNMTGTTPFLMFSMAGSGSYKTTGATVSMTDAYVPSGATSFHVSDASGLKVGDSVLVNRPVTQAWVHYMGMDTLKDATGASQTWISAGSTIRTDRTIAGIQGDQVTLDAPLADSFDSSVLSPPGASLDVYTFAGRVSQVGVEHLQVVAPALNVIISSPQFRGVELGAVSDAWVSDVAFQDTQNTVTVDNDARRLTLDNVHVSHTVMHTGDRMADFGLSGTQVLVNKCSSDGNGEWPLVTQGEVSGPIVALHFTSSQAAGVGPHQRWAVGLLTDSAQLPNAPDNYNGGATGISYSDRGNHGSGQGWAMGWGVAWNVTTPFFVVQQPPGAQNFCIGCVGKQVTAPEAGSGKAVPDGVYDSPGVPVTPNSLYLAQLCERVGAAALTAVGYSPGDCAGAGGAPGNVDAGEGGEGGPVASPDAAMGSAGSEGGAGAPANGANGSSGGGGGGAVSFGEAGGCGCVATGSSSGTGVRLTTWVALLVLVGRRRSLGRRASRRGIP
jgi:hypothetical protein